MHKRSILFSLLVILCFPAIATAQGSFVRKGESATFGNLGVVVSEDVAAGSAGFSVSLAGRSDFGFAIARAIGSGNAEGWAMSQSLDGYVYRKEMENSEIGFVLTESASLAWGRNRSENAVLGGAGLFVTRFVSRSTGIQAFWTGGLANISNIDGLQSYISGGLSLFSQSGQKRVIGTSLGVVHVFGGREQVTEVGISVSFGWLVKERERRTAPPEDWRFED